MDVHKRTLYASMSASRVVLANDWSRLPQMPKNGQPISWPGGTCLTAG